MDLSRLSTEDLRALKAGDLSKVSTEGLRLLRPAPVTAGGVAAEGGKGLIRGLSDAATMAAEGVIKSRLGPIGGDIVMSGLRRVAAPSRELIAGKPENEAERFAGTAAEIFGSGAAGGGVRSAGAATLNALAALGGATGEQVGGETGRLVGTLAPTVAGVVTPMTVKGAIRGGEGGRRAMEERIATFRQAGAEPSAGQATGSRALTAFETGASKVPGGAGVMARASERQAQGMGANVEDIAEQLSRGATGTKAGLTLEKGISDFVQRFKGEQTKLYDTLDTHIPKAKPVDMTNTINAMDSLNADIAGAPALSKFFKNSTIQALQAAMKSDTAEFTTRLPYEALKKVRTLVGNEISNANLLSQVPRDKWKALYAALSRDMEGAAKEAGPQAVKAFERANKYSAAGYGRIESTLDRVAGKDTAEKIFQTAISPSEIKEGASTINAVLRSIKPAERDVVKAAFIKRLGNANPGVQDAAGEVFSANTFLTNWNKISPEAKRVLFSDKTGNLRFKLDEVAKAASMIREGSKVFANPSGTAQATANIGGIAALAGSVVSGNVPLAAALLGGIAGTNLTARLLTNPKFVDWLATSTKASPSLLPTQLNQLAQQFNKNTDAELKDDVMNYISSVKQKAEGMVAQPQTQPQR